MSQLGRSPEESGRVFRDALIRDGAEAGVSISPALADAMTRHYAVLQRWAQRINLTAITDPIEAARKHGVDSLFAVELLDAGTIRTVADVGSGAGFPGIVLALARPLLHVKLLEPIRKRASFLRVALSELARPDVEVLEERLDPVRAGDQPPWRADAIVSRATIPPLELIPIAAPWLEARGRLILMAGSGAPPVEKLGEAAARAGMMHRARHERRLPGGDRRVLDELLVC